MNTRTILFTVASVAVAVAGAAAIPAAPFTDNMVLQRGTAGLPLGPFEVSLSSAGLPKTVSNSKWRDLVEKAERKHDNK